jgi:hypothetical protein
LRRRGHLCQDDCKYRQSLGSNMSSVARVTEIIASSKKSFDDAIESGVKRATKTLKNVGGRARPRAGAAG